MVRTTILALDGALASSVTITIDVLAMANRISVSMGRKMPFEVQLVGSGAHLFRPFLAFAETTHAACDLFIVPAQGLSKAPCYRERLAQTDAIDARRMIDEAVVAGAHVASSCTGTLLLASGSQLNGLMATTAWWLAPVFHQMYPKVQLDTSELILTDGQFTTAGAAMAQMDLMMRLVARYAGAGVAESCARRMVLDERRSQLPYMAVGLLAASNEAIARAAAWARTRLQEAQRAPCPAI